MLPIRIGEFPVAWKQELSISVNPLGSTSAMFFKYDELPRISTTPH
jgi:hypothetical protein